MFLCRSLRAAAPLAVPRPLATSAAVRAVHHDVTPAPEPPKRQGKNSFSLYIGDQADKKPAGIKSQDWMSELGRRWRAMPEFERKRYERKLAELKAQHQQLLNEYHRTYTPAQIAAREMITAREAAEKLAKRAKRVAKKENPQAKTSFTHFMMHLRSTLPAEQGKYMPDVAKLASAQWAQMSEEDKAPWIAKSQEEKSALALAKAVNAPATPAEEE
ncbi:hypothetical protein AMAG_06426 [Allomyces macrogynus ATCC 38327]|uniref:HMG box domain-containing protein n=1 Tax=Allomyces macrogynus (strain ATCC 38327) TaxID=578462 RepID=A0A0L0SGN8_ALLM3|nr:hypothetical protein AMAG_06426 [Allomyces macrogynus ATCC 38327]|eukprot:KNE61614.1 hypothetical protein AMAG_06426 [Allomyces macrogynus ATCC 38327]